MNARKIARNYHHHVEKKKQANIMEITKKDCKNKHEINIENYLMKEVILKGSTRDRYKNMSDEDQQKLKEYKKTIVTLYYNIKE